VAAGTVVEMSASPDGSDTSHARPDRRPLDEHQVSRPLDGLVWDNRFTDTLPADPREENRRRQVAGAAYSRVEPTATAAPRTLAWSAEMADLLGLDPAVCASDDFAAVFSGNRVPDGADPFAMAYGGHQFGNWAGQLGDGRAIALGEVIDRHGAHQMLQLKGAGPTPYSRTADGRAVLRSSIREFLCSEAMHHLGVPTTRALSLVATGDLVVRDMLYDGNARPEPGAVVCRVAPSFTRFGNFQLPAARGDMTLLRALVEHTLGADFPGLTPPGTEFADQVHALFAEVCRRTADLAVHWMRVGFVHGVLNTDNMSILGLTIDYGPYGWLESFDPGWTPNTTDAGTRRYRYGMQPEVVQWNLVQLANALVMLTEQVEPFEAGLVEYRARYADGFRSMMIERLGWGEPIEGEPMGPAPDDTTAAPDADAALINDLFRVLVSTEIDQVVFFRHLARVPVDPAATDDDLLAALADAWYQPEEVAAPGSVRDGLVTWLCRWAERARAGGLDDSERISRMDAANPLYVLRNYLAQEAIDLAETGDVSLVHELLDVLRHPYTEQPGRERFAAKRPEWARHKVGCSMLSCSS
jgi:uncharacterized protein YdiU (UPF0061 family)